jgi:copper chaperone NosL
LRRAAAFAALLALLHCAGAEPAPAPLDAKNDLCRVCRMPVSDPHLAAELVAPGEEPLFFDDIGCLRDHLGRSPAASGGVAYVADHRTGAFVRADRAVFTRCAAVDTPMASHLLAHGDAASRDADPAARGGASVAPRDILGGLR